MRFRVIWLRGALTELARAYLAANSTGESGPLTTLVAQVDQVLTVNPQHVGESRADNNRILIRPPLVIEYEVFDDERVVVVTALRYLA